MKHYIGDMLDEYLNNEKNYYPWHMPGHKRKGGTYFYKDVTEVPGLDDYHHPTGGIKDSLDQLKEIYGTDYSKYLINGSTSGILAAISSVCKIGDGIIVVANCHKAVFNAVNLLNLEAHVLSPAKLSCGDLFTGIHKADLETILDYFDECYSSEEKEAALSKVRAMVITSPTYEGIISDIEEIATMLHKLGIVLIVDEAHGAHFPFSDIFPDSAVHLGADIVIQSLHKTLPCMTQTAIIHVSNQTFSGLSEQVDQYLSVFQSSSPSYVLMANMEAGILKTLERSKQGLYEEYRDRLISFREKVKKLTHIKLLDNEDFEGDYDLSRLTFLTKGFGQFGDFLLEKLEQEYGLVLEMAGVDYAVAISTIEDTEEDFERFFQALLCIDKEIDDSNKLLLEENFENFFVKVIEHHDMAGSITQKDFDSKAKSISIYELYEKVKKGETLYAADLLHIYPPGIPLLYREKPFTREAVVTLMMWISSGKEVRGVRKEIDNN